MGCCLTHSDILLHGANHMTDVGLDASVAARVVALMAVCGMAGKVANGLLADRIGAKWALAGFLALQAVMVPFFLAAHEAPSFYAWAILFGLGYGGPMPVYAMLFREYFGTRAIGAMLGVFFMVASFGMGAGGLMGGVLHGMYGAYTVPFLISTAAGIMSTILVLTLPAPKRRRKAGASAGGVIPVKIPAV
jgi:MFS family permease